MNEKQLDETADAFGIEALSELAGRIATAKAFADPVAFEEIPKSRWELYHMDVRFLRDAAVRAGKFNPDIPWTVVLSILLLQHVARKRLAAKP